MRSISKLLPILALSFGLCGIAAAAPALDAQGKCRDNGRFVAAAKCSVQPAAAAKHCRDIKTKKFAKCSAAGTEPVPAGATP